LEKRIVQIRCCYLIKEENGTLVCGILVCETTSVNHIHDTGLCFSHGPFPLLGVARDLWLTEQVLRKIRRADDVAVWARADSLPGAAVDVGAFAAASLSVVVCAASYDNDALLVREERGPILRQAGVHGKDECDLVRRRDASFGGRRGIVFALPVASAGDERRKVMPDLEAMPTLAIMRAVAVAAGAASC
jgi:hypothetical protein